MKRKVIVSIVITIILITTPMYIHSKYFFNPITFKRDNITYLPFSWYENPMTYSYTNFINNKILGDKIDSEKDISFLYKELKKSRIIGPAYLKSGMVTNKSVIGVLTINSSKAGGCIVTIINWFGKRSRVCEVSGEFLADNHWIGTKLVIDATPKLQNFLITKFYKRGK